MYTQRIQDPFDQGRWAAEYDYSWIATQHQIGITECSVAICEYAKIGDIENTVKWLAGYQDSFDDKNKRLQLNLPLPKFR